ncbi:hypothetical protein E2C01_035666 [Portunus trituberculatus]|uniref:Uncharacterized protein n=1 Tax=Portunus trituberculatus TaxID=210409 RepID=A0A5B7FAD1_PORTR|nr:hypothetical protein [Portunus trituberculatus]
MRVSEGGEVVKYFAVSFGVNIKLRVKHLYNLQPCMALPNTLPDFEDLNYEKLPDKLFFFFVAYSTCRSRYLKNMGTTVQLPPISGTGNFIYSGTPIRAHITTQAHLWCNHLEPGYLGDMYVILNPSTNGNVSRWYMVGFEPTHGRLPNPTLTTSTKLPPDTRIGMKIM